MLKRWQIVFCAGLLWSVVSAFPAAAQNIGSIGILNKSKIKYREWEKDFAKKFEVRENHVFDKFSNIGYAQIDPIAFQRVVEEHIKKAYRKLPIVIEDARDLRYAAAAERVENLFIIELDSQLVAEISASDLNTVTVRGLIEGKLSVVNTTTNKVLGQITVEVKKDIKDDFHLTRGFGSSIDKAKEKLLELLADEVRDLEPDLYRAPRFDPVKISDEYYNNKEYYKAYRILAAAERESEMRQEIRSRLEMLKQQFSGIQRRVVGIAFVGNQKIQPKMIGLPEITTLADQEIEGYKRAYTLQFSDIVRKGFDETYWLVNGKAYLAVLKKQIEDFYGVTPVVIEEGEDILFSAQARYVDDLILVEVDGLVRAKYNLGIAETQLSGVIKAINTQTENVVFTLPVDFSASYTERSLLYKNWAGAIRGEVSPPGICHFARDRLLRQFGEALAKLDHNFGADEKMDILFKAREYDKKGEKSKALALLSRWWEDNGKNVQADMERLQIEVVGELIGQNKFQKAQETLNDFSSRFPNTAYMDRVEEYMNFLSMANSIAEIEQTPQGFQRAIEMWNIFIRKFPRSSLVEVAKREIKEYERKIAASQIR